MISLSYQTPIYHTLDWDRFWPENHENGLVVEVVGCVVFCGCLPFKKKKKNIQIIQEDTQGSTKIAGWKMDPDWRCIILFKNGEIPLSNHVETSYRRVFYLGHHRWSDGTSTEVLYGEAKRSWHDPLGYWHANETIHFLRRSCAIDCVGYLPWLRPEKRHVGV